MKQWEYKFEHATPYRFFKDGQPQHLLQTERSNQLGKQGWELVAIWQSQHEGAFGVYKRRKRWWRRREQEQVQHSRLATSVIEQIKAEFGSVSIPG